MGPSYEARGYESSLQDRESTDEFDKNRYEILEFWGTMDTTCYGSRFRIR